MWKDLKNSNKSTTYGLDSTIWPLKFGALVGAVTLNPERDAVVSAAADGPHTQQMAA